MFRLYCLASGRALVGAYPRRCGPFVSYCVFWNRKFGIEFCFRRSILGPSVYINYALYFRFAWKLWPREFPSGNSRANISQRGLLGKKHWSIGRPRLRKVFFVATVSHPIPTLSHHSPFVNCFHRAMDRSLGRDSRRRQLVS